MQNVLGLAPKSLFWDGLQKSYFFKDNRFAMRICYFPNFESLQINYQIQPDQSMIEVPVDRNQFGFLGQLNIKNKNGHMIQKELSTCIHNSKDLLFQTTKGIYQILLNKICVDPFDCSSPKDFKSFDDKDVAFEIFVEAANLSSRSSNNSKSSFIDFQFKQFEFRLTRRIESIVDFVGYLRGIIFDNVRWLHQVQFWAIFCGRKWAKLWSPFPNSVFEEKLSNNCERFQWKFSEILYLVRENCDNRF